MRLGLRSVRTGQGYLLNDDRASGGTKEEADMLGCSHCQTLMRRKLWADDGGMCHGCGAPVCAPCCDRIPQHGCEVFLRQLERGLEEDYVRRQNAIILGI